MTPEELAAALAAMTTRAETAEVQSAKAQLDLVALTGRLATAETQLTQCQVALSDMTIRAQAAEAEVPQARRDLETAIRDRDKHIAIAEHADRERIEHQNTASEAMRQAAGARAEAAGLRSDRTARLG